MNPTKATAKKAGLFYFVFVMFAYTTGGPFGMEEMVTTSGPGLTLLYLLVIPFFWCIPVSLVAAELTTAIPVEGGFYRWVRASFGDFWGFLAGWWNWSASWLLGGSYAVLFSDYLATYFPSLAGWKHYLVSVALISLLAYINIRGIQMVGAVATVLEISVLIPVLLLCVIAATQWRHNPFQPFVPPHVSPFQVFGVGLALGLWLYSGYEQCSSVAEEIENPQRSYPRALAIVVPVYGVPSVKKAVPAVNHDGSVPFSGQSHLTCCQTMRRFSDCLNHLLVPQCCGVIGPVVKSDATG